MHGQTADAGAIVRLGRWVEAQLRSRSAPTIFARFLLQTQQAVPLARLKALLYDTFTAQTPLGARLSERTGMQDGLATYSATYAWRGGQDLRVDVAFAAATPNARIAGIVLTPVASLTLPPDPRAGYRLKATLHLPFAPGEAWFVFWGGETRWQNYHVDSPDQRHAFDFLVRQGGTTHRGDGDQADQYFAWGRRIVAPAGGVVVETENGLPDNRPRVQTDRNNPFGNHVFLNLGNGEFAAFAHLQRGSVRVKTGERVKTTQIIGLCGNSGNTSEPHLHFHIQDKPYPFRDSTGLPVAFVGYTSDGKRQARGTPVQGETLISLPF